MVRRALVGWALEALGDHDDAECMAALLERGLSPSPRPLVRVGDPDTADGALAIALHCWLYRGGFAVSVSQAAAAGSIPGMLTGALQGLVLTERSLPRGAVAALRERGALVSVADMLHREFGPQCLERG